MFTRKKGRIQIDLHDNCGSVNTARTYNVRRQEPWPIRILYNVNKDGAAADQDEHDKQNQDFFNCNGPQSNNAVLFGPTEVLPLAMPTMVLGLIESPPDFKSMFRNVGETRTGEWRRHVNEDCQVPLPFSAKDGHAIEKWDAEDAIASAMEETKKLKLPSTIVHEREHKDKLSVFMKAKGITEKNTQEIEDEKKNDDFFITKLYNLEEKYMEVCKQPNRKKTTFMLRPDEPTYILDLIDSSVSRKFVNKGRMKNKSSSKHSKRKDSSLGLHIPGDAEFPLVSKKSDASFKKVSPAQVPLRAPVGKYAKKAEDEASKVAVPAGDIFVPRKEYKLKTTNVNDFLKNNDAEMHKKRVPIIQNEKKAKEDGFMITNVKKKKMEDDVDRNEAEKFKIPRKERVNPPLVDSLDQSEPLKKKVRVNPPSTPSGPSGSSIDILGAITDAMDASAAENAPKESGERDAMNMSPRKKTEDWVHPRMCEKRMEPPSLPPRFAPLRDDSSDDMEIATSSSETSPRPPKEKSLSPTLNFEEEKAKITRRSNDEELLTAGECKELAIKCPDPPLSMDNRHRLGDLYSTEALLRQHSHPTVINRPRPVVSYRLLEVNNVMHFAPAAKQSSKSFVNKTREIRLDRKDSSVTDPRIPTPLGILPSWQNTRLEINISGEADVATKEIDNGKTKQKGVQWGGTATKEFNPDEDVMVMEKRNKESAGIVVGEKEVGGKKYNIVKKAAPQSALPKSCLKPVPNPSTASMDKGVNGNGRTPSIRPSNPFHFPTINHPSSIGRTPRLADFVPPPGYELDVEKKKKEEREKNEAEGKKKKEREEREKMEERKKREREEMENRERDEKKKKEQAKKDILEGDRLKYREDGGSSSSSPQIASSSNTRTAPLSNKSANINQGSTSSYSSANLNAVPSTNSNYGRGNAACSSKSMSWIMDSPPRPLEKGSDIVGERPPMKAIRGEEAKYQLEMRARIAGRLVVQKTMRDGPVKEYPADRDHPSVHDQCEEQKTYHRELTMIEKDWKRNGIQPVWMQSLPCQTYFSFQRDAGLYWPIVQATDRINVLDDDFQSMDVLRSLGDNTHFATEKKTLMGIDTRLPNGMTHKERFESFMKGGKPEGRFKNRPMYSRVFSTQSEEEAREIHNERMEDERRLLREHEEVMRENAPKGVRIAPCEMNIDRPVFKDFPKMIQFYKNDVYEMSKPFQDPNWYCNKAEYYMPYTERANYLCNVINHFNKEYNALYEDSRFSLTSLDKAAFAASQIYFERMEGWKRVGVSEDDYVHLMTRHKERRSLMESSSFSLDKYMELTRMTAVDHSFFHFIVDWLSSIFKTIKPISEWSLDGAIRSAFKEVIMMSDEKTEDGQPRDAREVFYQAFKASIPQPPAAKKSRSSIAY